MAGSSEDNSMVDERRSGVKFGALAHCRVYISMPIRPSINAKHSTAVKLHIEG